MVIAALFNWRPAGRIGPGNPANRPAVHQPLGIYRDVSYVLCNHESLFIYFLYACRCNDVTSVSCTVVDIFW